MDRQVLGVVCYAVAAILAVLAAWPELPQSNRLLPLAVGFLAVGHLAS